MFFSVFINLVHLIFADWITLLSKEELLCIVVILERFNKAPCTGVLNPVLIVGTVKARWDKEWQVSNINSAPIYFERLVVVQLVSYFRECRSPSISAINLILQVFRVNSLLAKHKRDITKVRMSDIRFCNGDARHRESAQVERIEQIVLGQVVDCNQGRIAGNFRSPEHRLPFHDGLFHFRSYVN